MTSSCTSPRSRAPASRTSTRARRSSSRSPRVPRAPRRRASAPSDPSRTGSIRRPRRRRPGLRWVVPGAWTMPRSRSRRDAPAPPEADRDLDPASPPLVPVRNAVRTYAAEQPELRGATEGYVDLVTSLLDEAGINYLSVTGRTKSVASFAAKAVRQVDGRPAYDDPLTEITDQIGIRVITYLRDDVDAVADLLSDQLTLLDDRDMGQETAADGRWGYASRHLLVTATPSARRPTPAPGGGTQARRVGGPTPAGPPGPPPPRGPAPPTRPSPTAPPRSRCVPCCSTPGRSSSTTSATRARSPRSTCPTSTAASRWRPACSSSPTASSARSATGSRPR